MTEVAHHPNPAPKTAPRSTRRAAMASCSGCRAVWTGSNTAHCAAENCHQTFTGLTAFDAHRDGSHATGRFCKPPADVGLVDAGRSYPCWGFPWDGTQWWKGDDE